MKYKRIILAILFTAILSITVTQGVMGQETKKQLALGINYARHGSGDMDGILVNLDFIRNYTKKISIIYNLGFTLHGQKAFPGTIANNPSIPSDRITEVPQWVTAGIQISSLISYNFSKQNKSGLNLGAGPVLRYQLNSYPNSFTYYGQGNPWFQQPFYVFKEIDNNRINLGYAVRIGYDFKSSKNRNFAINTFLQNDTNGDMMVGLGLKMCFDLK